MPLSLESAYAKCERLANSHYENFPVAKMVPKRLRKFTRKIRPSRGLGGRAMI